MDKFQLQHIPTNHLIELREDIKQELKKRRVSSAIENRKTFISSLKPRHENRDEINKEIFEFNSKNLLSLRHLENPADYNTKFLPCLLAQDWSDVFPDSGGDSKFYVYAHVDPRQKVFVADTSSGGNYGGKPFYVGKGTGSRAHDLKRNQGHGTRIRQIISEGFDAEDIVKILFDNLTESKAFEIESKLIYFFGTLYEEKRKNGWLLNLEVPKTPDFVGLMNSFVTKTMIKNKMEGDAA